MNWQEGMNAAIAYIEENLGGAISLSEAARCMRCSTWEFQRLFSLLAHIPPSEYIRLRRLSLAMADLQAGKEKVIDIALKYGYESPAAFSRAFRRQYGISPSGVRSTGAALAPFPRITFQSDETGGQNAMGKFVKRDYVVRENGPVYLTRDMDKTVAWFENVLGWYGDVVERGANGQGNYGCITDYPGEIAAAHLTPFRGFHLFHGEPRKGVAGFIMVEGLDNLLAYIRANGWTQVSDISTQPWGARECSVTTVDGCVIRFFEET